MYTDSQSTRFGFRLQAFGSAIFVPLLVFTAPCSQAQTADTPAAPEVKAGSAVKYVAKTRATTAQTRRGWGLHMDQDFFIPARNEDRDYTMGVAFERFRQLNETESAADWLSPVHDVFDGWHEAFHGWLDTAQDGQQPGQSTATPATAKSFMLGVQAFTPDNLSASAPVLNDRPYSSLLFFSNKRVHAWQNRATGSDLRIGILGLNITRQVQTWLHRRYRASTGKDMPVDPQGWGNQISDGGELTALYRLASTERLSGSKGCDCLDWDLSFNKGLSLGYQTNAHLGFSGRAGKIDSKPWTLPWDAINRGNFIPSTSNDELYAWAAWRGRLVAYDALLQGQFRNSEFTINSGDIKRLVYESAVGVTAAWRSFAFTASMNLKTGEISGEADRTHFWGGLSVNYRY